MEKTYRIRTDVNKDKVVEVNLTQDVDTFEILSLKLNQKDLYRLHSSNYGIVVGRVLANGGFGIPNAKISIFVELSEEDKMDQVIRTLYPYASPMSSDSDGRRYNLLPDASTDECYQVVGTFPNKRLVLDNDDILEVYDKYWKYTTVSNHAGDYMIFGVPTGSQILHVDLDMSDIGILSQSPRDFMLRGYDRREFENPSQFKYSTNIDALPQIFSQNQSIHVYPFWGDETEDVIAITRADIEIDYTFETSCVFMGAVLTDSTKNDIGDKCSPSKTAGENRQLVAATGTIEMIRKTIGGHVEQIQIQGDDLIDEHGVWCYQIPMNLDYVMTDEYGSLVPTDNPNIGIATRASVRFRFTVDAVEDDGISRHRARYLVPNNPEIMPNEEYPKVKNPSKLDDYYKFGQDTPDNCFRDLYWNKVYTVKNYIPRIQNNRKVNTSNYSALRLTNYSEDRNPIPFNKLRVNISFRYRVICAIMEIVIKAVGFLNKVLSKMDKIRLVRVEKCVQLTDGFFESFDDGRNVTYIPGCDCDRSIGRRTDCAEDDCTKNCSTDDLLDSIQQRLAEEYELANLDFYNDWLNGSLYMPLWFWKRKKHYTYLFGLFGHHSVDRFCSCNNRYGKLRVMFPCGLPLDRNMRYNGGLKEGKYHNDSKYTTQLFIYHGIIKEVENDDGVKFYYYTHGNIRNPQPNESVKTESQFVRLYATDIVLLGSLNSCDPDGIPQMFRALPPSTANIPPIATIFEEIEPEAPGEAGNSDGDVDPKQMIPPEEGIVHETGMDWTSKSEPKDDPSGIAYVKGTIFDLACSHANTLPKTCVNVERMCELDVSRDEMYPFTDRNGDVDWSVADGMLTRYEIDKNDPRVMFATLNHYGFNPVDNDGKPSQTTRELDVRTGYYHPRFKFLNPQNFDGRLSNAAPQYTRFAENGKITYDYPDEDYITFRFGPDEEKHFYPDGGQRKFPLYNNSFYFYFGLEPGSTAIDKFNHLFFSPCEQREERMFTLNIEVEKAKMCCLNPKTDYGYISVNLKNVLMPYSYKLIKGGTVLLDESGINIETLQFGQHVHEGGMAYDYYRWGKLQHFTDGTETGHYLTNGLYTLILTDSAGNELVNTIVLEESSVGAVIESQSLGYEYIDTDEQTDEQTESGICNESAYKCGSIVLKSIIIDDTSYNISSATATAQSTSATSYSLTIKNDSDSTEQVLLKLYTMDSGGSPSDISEYVCSTGVSKVFSDGVMRFNFWKPCEVNVRIMQECDGKWVSGTEFASIISIENGKDFKALLNDMPYKFLNPKDFTYETRSQVPKYHDPAWSGYNLSDNAEDWGQYTTLNPDSICLDAMKYKLKALFSMADAGYLSDGASNSFYISAQGGKKPILRRGVYPDYVGMSTSLNASDGIIWEKINGEYSAITSSITPDYIADSVGYAVNDGSLANLVSNENYNLDLHSFNYPSNLYGDSASTQIRKNNFVMDGNRFAVFTNNAGLEREGTGCTLVAGCEAIPSAATQNPLTDGRQLCFGRVDGLSNIPYGASNYINAYFVDKRFDYIGVVYTPMNVREITGTSASSTTGATRGRIYLDIFNGIEMASKEGRIIDEASQTGNSADLEHEYSMSSTTESALTVTWNENAKRRYYSTTLSLDGRIGSEEPYDISEALIRGVDAGSSGTVSGNLVDIGVSRYGGYNTGDTISGSCYLGKYTRAGATTGTTYWLNTPSQTGYPTRKALDLIGIPYASSYTFSNTSFGYDISVESDSGGNVYAEGVPGETVSFSVDNTNPIRFGTVSVGADGNFNFKRNSKDFVFTAQDIALDAARTRCDFSHIGDVSGSTISFKIEDDAVNTTHNVMTRAPRVLNLIKDGDSKFDAFGAWKSESPRKIDRTNKYLTGGIRPILDGPLADLVFVNDLKTEDLEYVNMDEFSADGTHDPKNRYEKVGVELMEDGLGFNYYWGYLCPQDFRTDDANNTQNECSTVDDVESAANKYFQLKKDIISSGQLVCISVVRDYYHTSEDLINRRLQVWNFNGIYDTRPFVIGAKTVNGDIVFTLIPGENIMFTAKNTVADFSFEQGGITTLVGSHVKSTTATTNIEFILDSGVVIPSGISNLGIYLTVNNTIYYIETQFSR